jgi:osmotically-inducible protein OsmY
VSLSVQDGVVTLTGRVTQDFKVKDIEDVASRVVGVQEVRNELEVKAEMIARTTFGVLGVENRLRVEGR